MKASQLTAVNHIEIIEKDMPELQDGEALIQVRSTGLCGTDVLVYNGSLKPAKMPITNGHEAAGMIAKIRGDGGSFHKGDAVTFRGSWGCGHCEFCRSGRGQLCRSRRMLGVDIDGTMAEYVAIPVSQLFHLSANIPFSSAQSIVGISCALNLMHRIPVHIGMNAIIFGPGHNGLIILQLLRSLGFDKIIVIVGHRKNRAKLAVELGADATITYDDPELKEKVEDIIPGGPDVAIEASGSTAALNQCIDVVKKGGLIPVFSIYHNDMDGFHIQELYNKGISITGVKGAADFYADAERLLSRGVLKIEPLISHRYTLTETNTAFQSFQNPDAIRVIIENESSR